MKKLVIAGAVAAVFLPGCAAMGGGSAELVQCLDPNRRVVVEVGGVKAKPPAKPGGKAGRQAVMLRALAQGSSAFDPGGATLKDGGKKELDRVLTLVAKGTRKDSRPTSVGSVIISGHSDRLEAKSKPNLSEQRAMAVRDYLVSQGVDSKLMFWEGKGASEPVPVTKFCE
jgi:outer membrane protein OmpA-like peptidoglycan-associated protein